ncbi:CCND3 family protein [Megaselia abdita]
MNLVCEETVNDYVDTDIFRKANNIKYIYSSDDDSGTQTGGCGTASSSSAESGTGSSITSSTSFSSATQSHSHIQQSQSQSTTQYCAHITTKQCFANTAVVDKTFLHDRCLENLLKDEDRHKTVCSYFYTVQKDITPPMRKIVADWMMEVCFEKKCQEEVVLLALNYMDRFLATTTIRKTHLQLLAAACLLLASKLREPSCRGLSAEMLVYYTDHSISKQDLIQFELLVLNRLKWDLSAVTPLDFLELLLIRLPILSAKCPDLTIERVRLHAQAFISLGAKEHSFSIYSASTIAASSIAAALSGLHWHLRTGRDLRYLLDTLTDLTGVEQDYLADCMIKLEKIFEEHSRRLQAMEMGAGNF